MSERLKPCPLCDAKAYANTIVRERWEGRCGVYVSCTRKSCKLAGRVFATRALAIAAWNRRAADPVTAQLAEALRDARCPHYYCEDTWYSCPLAEDGCSNDSAGHECDCGADRINGIIDAALAAYDALHAGEEKEELNG